MQNRIYYIKEFAAPDARSGFQAQIESIFERNHFIPVLYPRVNYLSRLFFLNRFIRSVPEDSIVFFIHPLYAKTNTIILQQLLRKKCRPVCIVSDINSLRDGGLSFEKETRYWKHIPYFIFQNEKMRSFVEERMGKKISVNIGLFDLLFESRTPERKNSNEVIFAGNISKCPFVKDLDNADTINWTILADNDRSERPALNGSWGLIWEGDSIRDISNFKGRYLEWVSPLKLSNYLLNSLPVITHPDAAIAPFVLENNIGFTVPSLFEAGKKIASITEPEYQSMVENTRRFSRQISEGHFMQEAIRNILVKMNVSH